VDKAGYYGEQARLNDYGSRSQPQMVAFKMLSKLFTIMA
jgi:hypothetical protein